MVRAKGDLRNDRRCGFHIIKAREIDTIGIQGVIDSLKARVGDTMVYISVDIDSLDPAFAPGTSLLNPQIFLICILRSCHSNRYFRAGGLVNAGDADYN